MVKENLVSCAPELLYGNGGYYDAAHPIDQLLAVPTSVSSDITFEGLLYPQSVAHRSEPQCASSAEERQQLRQFFEHIGQTFNVCPPSILVKIKNALIWNNMVFTIVGNAIYAVYETYRAPDRDQQGVNLESRIPAESERLNLPDDAGNLFIGSAGSFNYGHWLVDDFAKLAATSSVKKTIRKIRIVMSGFNHVIDPVRMRGAELFLDKASGDEAVMLDRSVCYKVDTLYFPTPVSFHPVLKNPNALAFTRGFLIEAAESRRNPTSKNHKLFVNRASNWPRHIVNIEEVRSVLKPLDVLETDCESIDLLDQVSMFYNSASVMGIMGAAMTNQLFCRKETSCLYLAPSGWSEPFYWDMCDQIGETYKVYYGRADTASGPDAFRRSFSVDATAALQLK